MKVKELKKKSSVRVDIRYLQQLGIQSYGDDNLYPQTVRNIIAASRLMSVGQIESVEELLREVTTLLKVAPAVSLRPPTPE